MANVFGNNTQVRRGAMRAQDVELNIDGTTQGLLCQQAQLSFTQQVNALYELGSEDLYYVLGRSNGQASIGRVVGPTSLSGDVITSFGDPCEEHKLSLSATSCTLSNRGTAPTTTYTCSGAILTSVGATVTSRDVVVNEQMGFIFSDLDMVTA